MYFLKGHEKSKHFLLFSGYQDHLVNDDGIQEAELNDVCTFSIWKLEMPSMLLFWSSAAVTNGFKGKKQNPIFHRPDQSLVLVFNELILNRPNRNTRNKSILNLKNLKIVDSLIFSHQSSIIIYSWNHFLIFTLKKKTTL